MRQSWGLVLSDLYGRPLRRPLTINGETQINTETNMVELEDLTLAKVCAESLVNHIEGDEKHSYADKKRRRDLARRILAATDEDPDVPMDPKGLAELVDRVNKGNWHSVIVTDVCDILSAVLQTKQ